MINARSPRQVRKKISRSRTPISFRKANIMPTPEAVLPSKDALQTEKLVLRFVTGTFPDGGLETAAP